MAAVDAAESRGDTDSSSEEEEEEEDEMLKSHQCRICGKVGDKGIPMLLPQRDKLREWIRKYLSVEITSDNSYTDKVCFPCLKTIQDWITFHAQCQKTQRLNFPVPKNADAADPLAVQPAPEQPAPVQPPHVNGDAAKSKQPEQPSPVQGEQPDAEKAVKSKQPEKPVTVQPEQHSSAKSKKPEKPREQPCSEKSKQSEQPSSDKFEQPSSAKHKQAPVEKPTATPDSSDNEVVSNSEDEMSPPKQQVASDSDSPVVKRTNRNRIISSSEEDSPNKSKPIKNVNLSLTARTRLNKRPVSPDETVPSKKFAGDLRLSGPVIQLKRLELDVNSSPIILSPSSSSSTIAAPSPAIMRRPTSSTKKRKRRSWSNKSSSGESESSGSDSDFLPPESDSDEEPRVPRTRHRTVTPEPVQPRMRRPPIIDSDDDMPEQSSTFDPDYVQKSDSEDEGNVARKTVPPSIEMVVVPKESSSPTVPIPEEGTRTVSEAVPSTKQTLPVVLASREKLPESVPTSKEKIPVSNTVPVSKETLPILVTASEEKLSVSEGAVSKETAGVSKESPEKRASDKTEIVSDIKLKDSPSIEKDVTETSTASPPETGSLPEPETLTVCPPETVFLVESPSQVDAMEVESPEPDVMQENQLVIQEFEDKQTEKVPKESPVVQESEFIDVEEVNFPESPETSVPKITAVESLAEKPPEPPKPRLTINMNKLMAPNAMKPINEEKQREIDENVAAIAAQLRNPMPEARKTTEIPFLETTPEPTTMFPTLVRAMTGPQAMSSVQLRQSVLPQMVQPRQSSAPQVLPKPTPTNRQPTPPNRQATPPQPRPSTSPQVLVRQPTPPVRQTTPPVSQTTPTNIQLTSPHPLRLGTLIRTGGDVYRIIGPATTNNAARPAENTSLLRGSNFSHPSAVAPPTTVPVAPPTAVISPVISQPSPVHNAPRMAGSPSMNNNGPQILNSFSLAQPTVQPPVRHFIVTTNQFQEPTVHQVIAPSQVRNQQQATVATTQLAPNQQQMRPVVQAKVPTTQLAPNQQQMRPVAQATVPTSQLAPNKQQTRPVAQAAVSTSQLAQNETRPATQNQQPTRPVSQTTQNQQPAQVTNVSARDQATPSKSIKNVDYETALSIRNHPKFNILTAEHKAKVMEVLANPPKVSQQSPEVIDLDDDDPPPTTVPSLTSKELIYLGQTSAVQKPAAVQQPNLSDSSKNPTEYTSALKALKSLAESSIRDHIAETPEKSPETAVRPAETVSKPAEVAPTKEPEFLQPPPPKPAKEKEVDFRGMTADALASLGLVIEPPSPAPPTPRAESPPQIDTSDQIPPVVRMINPGDPNNENSSSAAAQNEVSSTQGAASNRTVLETVGPGVQSMPANSSSSQNVSMQATSVPNVNTHSMPLNSGQTTTNSVSNTQSTPLSSTPNVEANSVNSMSHSMPLNSGQTTTNSVFNTQSMPLSSTPNVEANSVNSMSHSMPSEMPSEQSTTTAASQQLKLLQKDANTIIKYMEQTSNCIGLPMTKLSMLIQVEFSHKLMLNAYNLALKLSHCDFSSFRPQDTYERLIVKIFQDLDTATNKLFKKTWNAVNKDHLMHNITPAYTIFTSPPTYREESISGNAVFCIRHYIQCFAGYIVRRRKRDAAIQAHQTVQNQPQNALTYPHNVPNHTQIPQNHQTVQNQPQNALTYPHNVPNPTQIPRNHQTVQNQPQNALTYPHNVPNHAQISQNHQTVQNQSQNALTYPHNVPNHTQISQNHQTVQNQSQNALMYQQNIPNYIQNVQNHPQNALTYPQNVSNHPQNARGHQNHPQNALMYSPSVSNYNPNAQSHQNHPQNALMYPQNVSNHPQNAHSHQNHPQNALMYSPSISNYNQNAPSHQRPPQNALTYPRNVPNHTPNVQNSPNYPNYGQNAPYNVPNPTPNAPRFSQNNQPYAPQYNMYPNQQRMPANPQYNMAPSYASQGHPRYTLGTLPTYNQAMAESQATVQTITTTRQVTTEVTHTNVQNSFDSTQTVLPELVVQPTMHNATITAPVNANLPLPVNHPIFNPTITAPVNANLPLPAHQPIFNPMITAPVNANPSLPVNQPIVNSTITSPVSTNPTSLPPHQSTATLHIADPPTRINLPAASESSMEAVANSSQNIWSIVESIIEEETLREANSTRHGLVEKLVTEKLAHDNGETLQKSSPQGLTEFIDKLGHNVLIEPISPEVNNNQSEISITPIEPVTEPSKQKRRRHQSENSLNHEFESVSHLTIPDEAATSHQSVDHHDEPAKKSRKRHQSEKSSKKAKEIASRRSSSDAHVAYTSRRQSMEDKLPDMPLLNGDDPQNANDDDPENNLSSMFETQEMTIQCVKCDQYFTDYNELLAHHEVHTQSEMSSQELSNSQILEDIKNTLSRTEVEDYSCSYCRKVFGNPSEMEGHISTSHLGVNIYQCIHCPNRFSTKNRLNKHMMQKHTGKYSYDCNNCDKIFMTKLELLRHNSQNHPMPKKPLYHCTVCQKPFKTHTGMEKHREKEHGIVSENIPILANTISDQAMRNVFDMVNPQQGPVCCKHCTGEFNTVEELKSHCRKAHKHLTRNKTVSCNFCSEKFKTKEDLDKHCKKTHKNVSVFDIVKPNKHTISCKYCSDKFKDTEELYVHCKRIHRQLWFCNECRFSASKDTQLKTHKLKHESSRLAEEFQKSMEEREKECSFPCPYCNLDFVDDDQRAAHSNEAHAQDLPYPCDVCPMRHTTEELYNLHAFSHEPPKSAPSCNICDKTFSKTSLLQDHMKWHDDCQG